MITDIITIIVIPLIGLMIKYYLVPFLEVKTTADQRQMARDIVFELMKAAEQLDKIGAIDIPKKDFVLQQAANNEILLKYNVTVNDVDKMIESLMSELQSSLESL